MSRPEGNLIEIDQLGIDILKALVDHDGKADSTALREYLGLDGRSRFNYRISEYLEPEGLIETTQPEPEPGMYPPKIISLTEGGKQYLDELNNDEDASRGIAERLERIEEQVDGLRKENQELREENQELRESDVSFVVDRVPELTGDVDELQSTVRNLQEALGEIQTHPVIENENAGPGLNEIIIMANACRRVIESEFEHGDELIEEQSEIVREKANKAGALFDEN